MYNYARTKKSVNYGSLITITEPTQWGRFRVTKFTWRCLRLSHLAQASFLQKNQTCKTVFWYLSFRDDTFDLKLSLKSSISVHLFWSLWFYFRGFCFCLHKMFWFVFLEQPDNNGCQKILIRSNNDSKCAISRDNV